MSEPGAGHPVTRGSQRQSMRERPEKPFFGPETPRLDPPERPAIKPWRSVAKAVSWRVVGTIDTLLLSFLLITYLGPIFGAPVATGDALETAGYIAITEVVTKFILYFLHERAWSLTGWGIVFRKDRHRETMRRTSIKTGLWRFIASLDTFALAWFFTGSVATAASIGGLEIFTKLVLYFFHERIWARLPFGLAEQDPQAKATG
ncbi:DUF2061 domain-containing protein [Altererythrobacter arenosus]|uniref:DUF2061 domain-containing protein n=1 Tax=Altererythrobacter arenosus TaxID=3032592 RepID=A0ABY8FWD8_9SPHN|nr:DUF2061 domain-containing protein [Altererythrobacter sp. CAU 1644]WFL78288.1 DUF2061 domain-containing protein [Altererythrobacter sp. CAU 1644]